MRFLCLATFVLAMTASSASAATPFRAGDGNEPAVAVGLDGAGHVAWQVTGSPAQIGYCRVSAQASICNRSEPLSFPGAGPAGDSGRPQVFAPSAGRVVIVATCSQCLTPSDTTNRTYKWTSTDNGQSFTNPAVEIGRGPTTGGFGTLLADESFVGVEGSEAKAAELTEAPPVQFTSFVATFGSDIARDPVSNHLVAVTNNLSQIRNGAFNGTLSTAEINNSSNWVGDQGFGNIEPANRGQSLAAGPRGVFVAYESTLGSDERAGLRKYNSTTRAFGSPTYVEGTDPIDADPDYVDSFQDAAGRLHLAWLSLYDGGRLRYRVSDTAGNNLTAAANLATHDSFIEPELGAAGDGHGFVTWTTSGGEVRVVALDPQAEQAPPGGQIPDPAPAAPVAPATPPGATYSGPSRARVVRVPGASITFTAPKGCVARGQRFRVRLVWKRQKRKGNLFVKIFRTDFYIGRKIVKKDLKAPFVQTLTVSAGSKAGSTVTVKARAFIKVKHGRGPKKSISTTLRVCS